MKMSGLPFTGDAGRFDDLLSRNWGARAAAETDLTGIRCS